MFVCCYSGGALMLLLQWQECGIRPVMNLLQRFLKVPGLKIEK